MPILSLTCANCSAPLEIDGDTETLTCGYCGSVQILEHRGGTISLKKVEGAIHAVQRGTDLTAAELAMSRLERERSEVFSARAAAIADNLGSHARARSVRTQVTGLVFLLVTIFFYFLESKFETKQELKNIVGFAAFVSLIAIPAFVFFKMKLPEKNPKKAAAEFDVQLARIESHLRVNRAILDGDPH